MKQVGIIIEKVADFLGYVSGWLVPAMMLLVAVEVFMRYVLHDPAMVADEFSAYMLVALSYLGLSYTWRQGGHVRITLLVSRLPVQARFCCVLRRSASVGPMSMSGMACIPSPRIRWCRGTSFPA